ncbi:ABC transporter permease [Fulvivirga kasyanovii]|uniref:ABC transporter permease n=1 Tax=Fulvivirga kasyanovii TaxID=396812 RepID=A0ABW9S070_9BACT|nr:ABC transporter permease [Fulvivirga kasyanovii]MTI29119.1 ABC transporter permease [Fulvivirga kasyanovii]
MIKNYLKITYRNLKRNKIYVLINTLGMGIAMACCLTAYLLIAYNLEFDDHFNEESVDHVVKTVHHYQYADGEADQDLTAPIMLGPEAASDIPAILRFTRFTNQWGILSSGDRAFEENLRFADISFFRMFKMELQRGSFQSFENNNGLLLSDEAAKKYFADEDPIGKIVKVEFNNKTYETVVGGVLEKLPLNISFNIDVLLPMKMYIEGNEIGTDEWDHSVSVLFQLSNIDQLPSVEQTLQRYISRKSNEKSELKTISYELLPFRDLVINGEVNKSDLRLPIPYMALTIFSVLGFIILLIACFNLTNTTIALTARRMKEIGLRKVVGSSRTQIIGQYLFEMAVTIALAIAAGVLLAQIIVPEFAAMWQLRYGLNDLNSLNLVIALIALLVVAVVLAGIYPAMLNSKSKPIVLLKGSKKINGTNPFTRLLLVLQFALSIIVLIAGTIFTLNADYQKDISFGYRKDRLINVSVQDEQVYNRYKNAIADNPDIAGIAGAENHISPYSAYEITAKFNDDPAFKTLLYRVGAGYFEVVGLEMINGRGFTQDSRTDSETAIIVNENFVANHRLIDPIDMQLFYHDQPYRIVGVVSNHLDGLKQHDSEEHVYMLASPDQYKKMVIGTGTDDVVRIQHEMEAEWRKLFPDQPFLSTLQEEVIYMEANAYNHNLKRIFFFLTVLGCLLSVSGIYALASLNIQKRTKEIGVRKVLGATIAHIMVLLNKEFAFIMALAMVAGGAGGFFITQALLGDLYAQHIEVGWVPVICSCLLLFIIGLSASSGIILRVAVANPRETLRDE